jgi:hypothetical protein
LLSEVEEAWGCWSGGIRNAAVVDGIDVALIQLGQSSAPAHREDEPGARTRRACISR